MSTEQAIPCHICGGDNFETTRMVDRRHSSKLGKPESATLERTTPKGKTLWGKPLKNYEYLETYARLCLKCGNVQIFAQLDDTSPG